MPLRVNDFVIQAKVEDEPAESGSENKSNAGEQLSKFKAEILDECKELIEEYLRKKEGR